MERYYIQTDRLKDALVFKGHLTLDQILELRDWLDTKPHLHFVGAYWIQASFARKSKKGTLYDATAIQVRADSNSEIVRLIELFPQPLHPIIRDGVGKVDCFDPEGIHAEAST